MTWVSTQGLDFLGSRYALSYTIPRCEAEVLEGLGGGVFALRTSLPYRFIAMSPLRTVGLWCHLNVFSFGILGVLSPGGERMLQYIVLNSRKSSVVVLLVWSDSFRRQNVKSRSSFLMRELGLSGTQTLMHYCLLLFCFSFLFCHEDIRAVYLTLLPDFSLFNQDYL